MVSNARSMTPGDIFLQSPAVNRQTILHTRIHTSNLNEYRTSKFKRDQGDLPGFTEEMSVGEFTEDGEGTAQTASDCYTRSQKYTGRNN